MITSGFGNFEKLRIESYKDEKYSQNQKLPGIFHALINPETYTTRHRIEFCDTQAPGRSMPVLKFNKVLAQEISFDFLFDSTGVAEAASIAGLSNPAIAPKAKAITDQINDFNKRVLHYEGEIHRPYHLKIYWGTLLFKGVLTSIDIEYKLFNTDGSPMRAIAKCGFKGTIDEELVLRIEKKSSPDVTHERVMKESDRLDLMTKNIYNDQQYIQQVAEFNRLDSFRNIKPGTKIYFPSIEK
jgi:hypothetical protein